MGTPIFRAELHEYGQNPHCGVEERTNLSHGDPIICFRLDYPIIFVDFLFFPAVRGIEIFKCPGCDLYKSIADPQGSSMVVLRWQK